MDGLRADPVNLAVIGAPEGLRVAMPAAGWIEATRRRSAGAGTLAVFPCCATATRFVPAPPCAVLVVRRNENRPAASMRIRSVLELRELLKPRLTLDYGR